MKKREGVVTVVQSSGQYQVVIGKDVSNVYEAIMDNSNIGPAGSGGGSSDNSNVSALDRFVDLLSGLFQSF